MIGYIKPEGTKRLHFGQHTFLALGQPSVKGILSAE
jgi:hypothetical protein